ncbi:hypothetical protein TNCV_2022521 [Trichonephila clavipes]|nr:hypothetical protein TNCV_2022521 [Trichonephila clavipes]
MKKSSRLSQNENTPTIAFEAKPGLILLEDNRPARLVPTPKRHPVHHLEAITCPITYTLKVCLCVDRPPLIPIQIVCVPYVQGEPKQLILFHETFFLYSVIAYDSLYVVKKRCGGTNAIFRYSSYMLCSRQKERIAEPFWRYNIPSGQLGPPYVSLDQYRWGEFFLLADAPHSLIFFKH